MRWCGVLIIRQAGILILLFIVSTPGFSFGDLMTTSQERLKLDRQRKGLKPYSMSVIRANTSADEKSILVLDGLVKRHGGPNTIWVNGDITQRPAVAGVTIDANKLVENSVILKLSTSSAPLLLKPGQRFAIDGGGISENYRSINHKPYSSESLLVDDGESFSETMSEIE